MGDVILYRYFLSQKTEGLLKPIIYCCPEEKMVENAIPINIILAKKISELKPKRRTMRLAMCFEEILKTLPDNAIIKDFDVMFNPEYKIDILKIMVDACKRKPFSIIWPGKFEDGKLFYAENGYLDFKTFSVEDYDVTCIIRGGKNHEIFSIDKF